MRTFAYRCRRSLAAVPAYADDPKFEYGKQDDVKDVKASSGRRRPRPALVFTTGNSETTTATGGFKASRKTGRQQARARGAAAPTRKSSMRVLHDLNGNGTIDDADRDHDGRARSPPRRSPASSATTASSPSSTRCSSPRSRAATCPAGKESVFGGQVGYSRQLYKTKTAEAVGEFGYDFSHEDLVVGAGDLDPLGARVRGPQGAMTEGTDLDDVARGADEPQPRDLDDRDGGQRRRRPAQGHARQRQARDLARRSARTSRSRRRSSSHYDNRPAPARDQERCAPGFVARGRHSSTRS